MLEHAMRLWIGLGLPVAAATICGGCGCCSARPCMDCPDRYPLGAVNRAHYETMRANAKAADFILYRNEFVGESAELTPYGKDHLLEIAARFRSAPFPVLIERSESNSDPALDERRRTSVVQALVNCGLTEASQRTVVSPAYGKALSEYQPSPYQP
jgi:hypothetical protein